MGEPALYQPAAKLSHEVVSWLNETAAPRTVLQSRIGDKPLSIRVSRLVWQAEPYATSVLDCVFCAEGETAVLSLPRLLVEALISTVQHGLTLPSDPTRSLLLELALGPWLAALEIVLARNLQLIRVEDTTAKDPYIEFDVTFGSLAAKARLFLFAPLDGLVPSAFRVLGELIGQLPRDLGKISSELPVVIAREIGSLRAPIKLLRQAQPGDALLPEVIPFAHGQLILAADKLWAPAQVAGDRLILRGPFRLQSHPLRYANMTVRPQAEQAIPPSEADIDSVEITLVFECGRWPITLGTLRSINEGHVLELGRPVDGPVDIVANGQLIGRGDIVRVGEALGIRLLSKLAVNG
ncbi:MULTISPECIES: type III secretion system cytoplasmic ring protein SctQ [Bradyrhizobium]|uniref:type III secretion system cytoplasmic ring protein SctQ n=1 Tax=Bradyrhizobium TaxID=374 RepID=UPI0003F55878|nr:MULTISPECIES: type III secretion system cytoplasmic ring protein SctQ [Bradyrhizobium]UFW51049.1 type III secretion system cytoplasmic ring protein SctQ [Bradyrhizobium arachidis]